MNVFLEDELQMGEQSHILQTALFLLDINFLGAKFVLHFFYCLAWMDDEIIKNKSKLKLRYMIMLIDVSPSTHWIYKIPFIMSKMSYSLSFIYFIRHFQLSPKVVHQTVIVDCNRNWANLYPP